MKYKVFLSKFVYPRKFKEKSVVVEASSATEASTKALSVNPEFDTISMVWSIVT